MKKNNFQAIRHVMKPRIPLQTLKFTDQDFAKEIEKALARRIENSIKERFNKQETK